MQPYLKMLVKIIVRSFVEYHAKSLFKSTSRFLTDGCDQNKLEGNNRFNYGMREREREIEREKSSQCFKTVFRRH
jgi:hypothetical protein